MEEGLELVKRKINAGIFTSLSSPWGSQTRFGSRGLPARADLPVAVSFCKVRAVRAQIGVFGGRGYALICICSI